MSSGSTDDSGSFTDDDRTSDGAGSSPPRIAARVHIAGTSHFACPLVSPGREREPEISASCEAVVTKREFPALAEISGWIAHGLLARRQAGVTGRAASGYSDAEFGHPRLTPYRERESGARLPPTFGVDGRHRSVRNVNEGFNRAVDRSPVPS